MTHETVQQLLLSLHENKLGPAVLEEIKAHVVFCRECLEIYEQWVESV